MQFPPNKECKTCFVMSHFYTMHYYHAFPHKDLFGPDNCFPISVSCSLQDHPQKNQFKIYNKKMFDIFQERCRLTCHIYVFNIESLRRTDKCLNICADTCWVGERLGQCKRTNTNSIAILLPCNQSSRLFGLGKQNTMLTFFSCVI